MDSIINSITGLVHLIASLLALVFGTFVLILKKGSKRHKRLGYAYFASMCVLLVTAFLIYHLYGKFGIFHYAALMSLVTILLGMVPLWMRQPKGWLEMHISFMYWSVIGLYMAFLAELMTRIPRTSFNLMLSLACCVVMVLAMRFYKKKVMPWKSIFLRNNLLK
jgi:uncharacterized membrane protein